MLSNVFLLSLSIFGVIIGLVVFLLIWNKPVLVIYIQLIYCCFVRFLIYQLHFTKMVQFASDFFTIILLIQIILQFNKAKTINIRKPLFFIVLFLLSAILSSILNSSSILFFIIGLRVYIKLLIFFIACVIFLKHEDIDKLAKFLLAILPINTVVAFYQYLIMGLGDDYIGGIFGNTQGCNGESNIYLTVVSVIAIVFYVGNKIKLWHSVISILQACMIAAISELKIIYFTLIIILLIVLVYTFPNKRAIMVTLLCGVALVLGLVVFLMIYPGWIDMITDFGTFMKDTAAGTYGTSTTLGRTVAGPYVFQNILIEPRQRIFGIGLGYGDRYLSMESSFFARYESLSFYLFAYMIVIIEVGLTGFIIYCLIFVSIIYESFRIKKKIKTDNAIYCCISFIASIFTFQQFMYDQSIFWDAAFIIYFCLSLPFIMEKEENETSANKTGLLKKAGNME